MAQEFYSVWRINSKRWTNSFNGARGQYQDPTNPFQLTKAEAEEWASRLNSSLSFIDYEVRPLDPKFTVSVSFSNAASNTIGPAINDYTCPGCKNDKCSRSEKSCWKCGYRFIG